MWQDRQEQLRELQHLRRVHRLLQEQGLRQLEAAMDAPHMTHSLYHLFESELLAEEVADAYRSVRYQAYIVSEWLQTDVIGWITLVGSEEDLWAQRIKQRTLTSTTHPAKETRMNYPTNPTHPNRPWKEVNPNNEPTGHFTGRCMKCGSDDLWDDNLHYGCNNCGACYFEDNNPMPRIVPNR